MRCIIEQCSITTLSEQQFYHSNIQNTHPQPGVFYFCCWRRRAMQRFSGVCPQREALRPIDPSAMAKQTPAEDSSGRQPANYHPPSTTIRHFIARSLSSVCCLNPLRQSFVAAGLSFQHCPLENRRVAVVDNLGRAVESGNPAKESFAGWIGDSKLLLDRVQTTTFRP